jgi:hypothetical protein
VYAVDLHKRIVRFNAAGQIDQDWPVPIGIARGGSHLTVWNGLLVISNPDSNTLTFLDPRRGVLRTMAGAGPEPIEMSLPIGVAAGPTGTLYVLDSDNNRVLVLAGAP